VDESCNVFLPCFSRLDFTQKPLFNCLKGVGGLAAVFDQAAEDTIKLPASRLRLDLDYGVLVLFKLRHDTVRPWPAHTNHSSLVLLCKPDRVRRTAFRVGLNWYHDVGQRSL